MNLFWCLILFISFWVGFIGGTYICTGFSMCGFSIEHTKYIVGEFLKDIYHFYRQPLQMIWSIDTEKYL